MIFLSLKWSFSQKNCVIATVKGSCCVLFLVFAVGNEECYVVLLKI